MVLQKLIRELKKAKVNKMDARLNQLEFIEDRHEYWYTEGNKHKQLFGVTSPIGQMLGKDFPDTTIIQLSAIYGHDVHSESEMWIKEGKGPSTEAGKWLVQFLKDFQKENGVSRYEAELPVSDFIGTASCIDIVATLENGSCVLFDIKTTSTFDRAYCSLQLSVYKRLFEENYGKHVNAMFVLGTKSRRSYRILEQDKAKVRKVLSINKAKTI